MTASAERLVKLEMAISQNIEAISSLTKTVDILAKAMKDEDKDLKESVIELNRSVTECNYKHSSVVEKLITKQKKLENIEASISNLELEGSRSLNKKATKEAIREMDKKTNQRVDELKGFIHKSLWWLFGGLIAVVSFLIKEALFKA